MVESGIILQLMLNVFSNIKCNKEYKTNIRLQAAVNLNNPVLIRT